MLKLATKQSRKGRRITWLISLCVAGFIYWASVAELAEIVRGEGRVVPAMRTQVIQNLEGGIVNEILVVEGDTVASGQIVARIDPTQFESAFQELREQRLALSLKLERLEAEKDSGESFSPSKELVEQAPEFARSEIDLFNARINSYREESESLEQFLDLKLTEVSLLAPLVERSAVSRLDLVRVEQQVASAQGELSRIQYDFETERAMEYAKALGELKRIEEQIRARQDQLSRTDVRTPVNGIVNKISVNTIGGVVRSGDPILEILPLGEILRIEGRIDPKDIGFVYVGMPATVKLTAFDFAIYGALKGSVVHVGADTVEDPAVRDAQPYYEVFIEVAETKLEGPEGPVEIRPGMQAAIELESGTRTVLQYLLKPLFRASEALTER